MKSHSIPSLLGIAAVLIAALVVAIAFGVATDSPTAQAQALHSNPVLDRIDYDMNDDGLIDHHDQGTARPVIDGNNGDLCRECKGSMNSSSPSPPQPTAWACPDTRERQWQSWPVHRLRVDG